MGHAGTLCHSTSSSGRPLAVQGLQHSCRQYQTKPTPRRGTATITPAAAKGQPEAAVQTDDGPFVKAVVGTLTQTLRFLGVGSRVAEEQDMTGLTVPTPRTTKQLMKLIEQDYKQRAYFVTGDISVGGYSSTCYFADPTVSFSGLQRWQSNLQLLVPFLIQPSIELYSLKQTTRNPAGLKATWRLETGLNFPWKPLIELNGATDYTLDDKGIQVVRHIESWEISGLQAIGQMLRPGRRREAIR